MAFIMEAKHLRRVALLLSLSLLTACGGGTKLYRSSLPPNLTINTVAESVTTTLNIHSVGAQCKTSYQGTVELDKATTELGIPTAKPTYLIVGFSSSSFLRGSNSLTSYDVLLVPRPGYRYEMGIRYVDNIYNVELFEVNRKTGKRRDVGEATLQNCTQ